MLFNALWTILLGVVGGIVSSLIISRVFFIQGEHQRQINFVNGITRKLGYIAAFFQSIKTIFEVSYDQDTQMQKEMQEKGYKCEMEYYAAHPDKDWISKDGVIKLFQKEINKTTEFIKTDILNNPVKDDLLSKLMRDIQVYVHDVSSIKEYSFSNIGQLQKREQELLKQYDSYIQMSGKKLVGLVFKDKTMIALFVLIGILIAGTIITYNFGI